MHRLQASLYSLPLLLILGMGITPLSAPLHAQAISGDLVGTVTDASGAVVPNATVTATNVATGVRATASSNASGIYRLSNLLPGNYNVSAE